MKRYCLLFVTFIWFTAGVALAIPGQTTAQFLHWARYNGIMVTPAHDEMSGNTYYHAVHHLSPGTTPSEVIFSAEPDVDGTIHRESIAVQHVGDMESYDIRKHRDVAHIVLVWVYGPALVSDFEDAKLVADYKVYQSPTHIAVYCKGWVCPWKIQALRFGVMMCE